MTVGFALGAIIHALPRVRRAVDPLLASYYSIPFFVFYPLLIALFGLNTIPLIVIGFVFATAAMVISTLNGLDRVPRVMTKTARVLRLSPTRSVWSVTLPSAAPYLFTGVEACACLLVHRRDRGRVHPVGRRAGVLDRLRVQRFRQPDDVRADDVRAGHRGGDERRAACLGAAHVEEAGARMTTQAWSGLNTRLLDGLLLVALFLAVWQGLYEYAGDAALTSPLTTLDYASSLVKTVNFWTHAQATLVAFAYALVISIVLGIVLGLVLGVQRFSGDVAEPILVALYTIPKITLYPLILLIFGLGVSAKVAFGVIHGVIPIILFTLNAVKNINPVLIRTSRVMRLSPWQTASTVLTPAVMPELITGVRVGFSLTMLGVLIGEMFASQRGLGFLIINGINLHNVRITTAVILIVVLFAILANGLLLAFDKRMHRGGVSP